MSLVNLKKERLFEFYGFKEGEYINVLNGEMVILVSKDLCGIVRRLFLWRDLCGKCCILLIIDYLLIIEYLFMKVI